jgi:hypothetical protein
MLETPEDEVAEPVKFATITDAAALAMEQRRAPYREDFVEHF